MKKLLCKHLYFKVEQPLRFECQLRAGFTERAEAFVSGRPACRQAGFLGETKNEQRKMICNSFHLDYLNFIALNFNVLIIFLLFI
jgi:hypothetical protein